MSRATTEWDGSVRTVEYDRGERPPRRHAVSAPHMRVHCRPGGVLSAGALSKDLTPGRAASAGAGVPVATVHHWAREGTIPSRKLGKRRIFIRPKIEALLLKAGR